MGLVGMWSDQKGWRPWRVGKGSLRREEESVRRMVGGPGIATRPSSSASMNIVGKGRTRSLSRARATPTPTSMNRAPSGDANLSPAQIADGDDEFEQWRRRVWLLRARMLMFVQQILSFATFEVLEPNWRKLEMKLVGTSGTTALTGEDREERLKGDRETRERKGQGVQTVDQLLRDHVDFLDTVLKETMLTSSRLLQAYSRLIITSSTFAMYASLFTRSAEVAIEGWEADVAAALDGLDEVDGTVKGTPPGDNEKKKKDESTRRKRWDTLMKFERNFNHWFGIFHNLIQVFASTENIALRQLAQRLNSVKPMREEPTKETG